MGLLGFREDTHHVKVSHRLAAGELFRAVPMAIAVPWMTADSDSPGKARRTKGYMLCSVDRAAGGKFHLPWVGLAAGRIHTM